MYTYPKPKKGTMTDSFSCHLISLGSTGVDISLKITNGNLQELGDHKNQWDSSSLKILNTFSL